MKKSKYLFLLIVTSLLGGCTHDYDELALLYSKNKEALIKYHIDYHSEYTDYVFGGPSEGKKNTPFQEDVHHNYRYALWAINNELNFGDLCIASCIDEEQASEYYEFISSRLQISDKYVRTGNFVYKDSKIAYLILWGKPLEKDGFLYYELEDNQTILFGDVCNCASEIKNEDKTTIIPDWVEVIGGSGLVPMYSLHSPNSDTLVIPDSVIEIRYQAFFQSSYKHIELSKNLKRIHSGSFGRIKDLEYIVIPESVEHIGLKVFHYGNIFCEAKSKPKGWNDNFAVENAKVYYADEWKYDENGVPVIITN